MLPAGRLPIGIPSLSLDSASPWRNDGLISVIPAGIAGIQGQGCNDCVQFKALSQFLQE